jgi:hypothetical protein
MRSLFASLVVSLVLVAFGALGPDDKAPTSGEPLTR